MVKERKESGVRPSLYNENGEMLQIDGERVSARFPLLQRVVTWLILPVVICLSQRLSHACLSIAIRTVKLRMAH